MSPVRELSVPGVWAEQIKAWRSHQRAAGRPDTTVSLRTYQLRRFAAEIAPLEPWQVTLDDLIDWMGARTWSAETRRSYRSALRSFYGWALDTGRVSENVALKMPKVTPRPPAPHPTPENAYRFALLTAGPRERLMVRLAAEIGLRRGEVALVHSRDLIERDSGWSLIVHGKGNRERVVPLPGSLALELCSLPPGYVFPGNDRGHLSARYIGKLVSRLLPEGVSMHSLRHRFATLAYSYDRDVFTVQQLLGHASPSTTQRYVQVADDDMRRLVQRVGAAEAPAPAGPAHVTP